MKKSSSSNSEYNHFRALLTRRGSSLHRWARERGYRYTSVVSAARGERHGQISRAIRAALASL
jgi:hypothetical protein